MSFSWKYGGTMETFNNALYSISYKVDVNGIRTEKHVTKKSTGLIEDYNFYYDGNKLISQQCGNEILGSSMMNQAAH